MSQNISIRNPRTGEADFSLAAMDAQLVTSTGQALRQGQRAWHNLGFEGRA